MSSSSASLSCATHWTWRLNEKLVERLELFLSKLTEILSHLSKLKALTSSMKLFNFSYHHPFDWARLSIERIMIQKDFSSSSHLSSQMLVKRLCRWKMKERCLKNFFEWVQGSLAHHEVHWSFISTDDDPFEILIDTLIIEQALISPERLFPIFNEAVMISRRESSDI